nr:gliding motility-associated C-terminal domain-containing protein [Flavobacteriales bacterium]HMR28822.1 gliding motility-associated C-terminal domain-containing protein [Flavobacteriales bacterium]
DANCACTGTPLPSDCAGVLGGSALPGTACDDGDACTTNDAWDANCACIGDPVIVDASFDYAQSAYCETSGSVTPWAADPSGSYLGSTGLVIDPSDGTIDISASAPGMHFITHTIAGTCPAVSIDTLIIDTMPDPLWILPGSICAQQGPLDLGTLVLGTSGGAWNGAAVTGTTFDPSVGPGSYPVTYTVANGTCTADLEQLILVTPGPLANAGADTTICGTTVQLQALVLQAGGTWSGPAGCLFDDPTSSNTNVSVATSGTYTFLWTVGQAPCIAVDSVTVVFHEPGTSLFVDAGEDQELAVVTNTTLSGQTVPGAQVLWTRISGEGHLATPEQPVTDVLGLAPGTSTFVLTATLSGCSSSSDTVLITVLDVFVPHGFSPNGDGVNDRFEVTGIEAFPANELKVFDRWGRPVFAQRGYDNGWDGLGSNGVPLIDDTYFFVLNLDEERTYNGYLIIKR